MSARDDTSIRQQAYRLLLGFLLFTILITISAISVNESLTDILEQDEREALLSISRLKNDVVSVWLQERLHDAVVTGQNQDIAGNYARWLSAREAGFDNSALQIRLSTIYKEYGYTNICLLDKQGRYPFSADTDHTCQKNSGVIAKVIATGKPEISDYYRETDGPEVSVDILAPLLVGHGEEQKNIGVVVLQAPLTQRLLPLIQYWPVPSNTGETLLVKPIEDRVIMLHRPPHAGEKPLYSTDALTTWRALVDRGLHSEEGLSDGLDYRGEAVLAASRKIDGTPWVLISKIDRAEVYDKLAAQRWGLFILSLLIVVIAGVVLVLYWRHQQHARAERLYRQALDRKALRSHYESVIRYANDIFMLSDIAGHIVDANERATELTGYSHDELLSMHAEQLYTHQSCGPMEKQWRSHEQGSVYETEFRRKDGSTLPVEISARIVEVEGKRYRQGIIRDITERRRFIEKLAKNESRLKEAQKVAQVGSWELDLLSEALWWSDENYRIFGVDPGAMNSYESFLEAVHPDDRAYVNKVFSSSVKNGSPYNIDHRLLMKDGSIKWVNERCKLDYDAHGKPLRAVGTTMDITLRKQAEDAARGAETFSTQILDTAQTIVLVLNPDGAIRYFNPFMETLFGYALADTAGKDWFETFLREGDRETTRALFTQAISGVHTQGKIGTVITRGGAERYIEWYDRPLKDHDGEVIGLLAIGHDITERKKAEDALWKSEERFALAMRGANDGLWDWDLQTNQVTYSPRWKSMLGYDEDELENTFETWEKLVHPDDIDRARQVVDDYLSDKSSDATNEFRMQHKDGQWVDILSRAYAVRDESTGKYVRFVGTHIDITERKQAEEKLRKSEDNLREVVAKNVDGILVIGNDGKALMANKAASTMLGKPEEQIVGEDIGIPFAPDESTEIDIIQPNGVFLTSELRVVSLTWDGQPAFVASLHDISERKAYTEKLEHEALYDSLTGLPNRNNFLNRLQYWIDTSMSERKQFVTLILYVRNFKEINTTLGHNFGDALLQHLGKRLIDMFPAADMICRLNGSQFALVWPGINDENDALIADKIIRVIEQPFEIEDFTVTLQVVIGMSSYPEHGEEPATLVRNAMVAMDLAETRGVNVAVYRSRDDAYNLRRLMLTRDLKQAIDAGGLSLHYQPKVDIKTTTVTDVEALARWEHPEMGMISPGEFIPLAENAGMMKKLSAWALDEAVAQQKTWTRMGMRLSVAVNLSTQNLLEKKLPQQIMKLLDKYQLSPDVLTLEITESAIMANPERALKVVRKLADMGVKWSIDDFGTGYSSFTYLSRLPVHEIKIDQSFIFDMLKSESNAAIVRSIIELGQSLGVRVVAEGVEDKETLDMLEELSCDVVQGYYVSRPLTSAGFEKWYHDSPWGGHRETG